jgi:LemA protein
MELVNILIIVSAVILILLLWIIVGVRHLKYLRNEVRAQFDFIEEDLRKRHDLLPNLAETLRMFDKTKENLILDLISGRDHAAREKIIGLKKIEYEHELSGTINQIIECGKLNTELGRDTNFLELKKEIDDLEKDVEAKTKKYNEMVRYYNRHRGLVLLVPIAIIFNYKPADIFEVEV